MVELPDRIYLLLKEHWPTKGYVAKEVRQFKKPTFRENWADKKLPKTTHYKRIKPKKQRKRNLGHNVRKSLS